MLPVAIRSVTFGIFNQGQAQATMRTDAPSTSTEEGRESSSKGRSGATHSAYGDYGSKEYEHNQSTQVDDEEDISKEVGHQQRGS